MDIKQIKELLAVMEKGGLRRLHIKENDFEVELEKQPSAPSIVNMQPAEHTHPVSTHRHEEPKKKEMEGKTINSPLVGTFYTSPSPSDPAFVKVGQKVDENTVVCIIEAMKVMNEVKAGVKGQIAEILVDNAGPVEFGTPLFRVT